MTNRKLPSDTCDVAYALDLIGGKWKIFIIWQLLSRRMRFSELRRNVPGISEPVLILQLKELQHDGVVSRIDYKTVPPHVEYELTETGRKLHTALAHFQKWGSEHRIDSTN
jgi:DNA-binding HxlR family transcriptional regulator